MAYRSTPTTPTSLSRIGGRISKLSLDVESGSSHGRSSIDRSPIRLSLDRSPRLGERKSSKISTTHSVSEFSRRPSISSPHHLKLVLTGDSILVETPTLQKRVVTRGTTELQHQLGQAQVDLKKATDQLMVAEDAKSRALDELKEMKKMAEEANSRLTEALFAQRRAEEISEVERFRVDELEQANIEAAQKRDEAWQSEMEAVQKQRSLDATALLAAREELERVSRELSAASEVKKLALEQADNAQKTAISNAKKIEDLSSALASLKESLTFSSAFERENEMGGSKWEAEARESSELAAESRLVIESLRKGIERAKEVESMLREREELLEKLNLELSSTRDSEFQASSSLLESKKIIEKLEREIQITKASKDGAFESMESITKQLEEAKMSLEETKLEISSLREKMQAMEASVRQSSDDLEDSHRSAEKGKIGLHGMGETIESLKLELENAQKDLSLTREREELAISNMEDLAEEASSLRNELRSVRKAEEKSKQALDDLAIALKEVTTEANQVKDELLSAQAELENLKAEAERYKRNVSSTEDVLQLELEKATKEIERLKEIAERAKLDAEHAASIWKEKEIGFINCIKVSKEEIAIKEEANEELRISLWKAEEEAREAQEEKRRLVDSVKQAEADVSSVRESLELVSVENLRLRDRLSKVERELEKKNHENEYLRNSEAAAAEEVDRLTRLLEAASAKALFENKTRSPGESDYGRASVDEYKASAEEIYDAQHILSRSDEKTNSAHLITLVLENSNVGSATKEPISHPVNMNGSVNIAKQQNVQPQYEPIDKMSVLRAPSPTRLDDAETLNSDEYDHVDGHQLEEVEAHTVSPARQKKKKPLLHRFGNLLKKKNHK
ncbi:putative WEB family protein At1g65010, chloroplastic isoform X2 [Nymphaea colorata]|nr:putative WEB family protein At1g65010, chloroplastic isoform X2 [Nymphaea colorata]